MVYKNLKSKSNFNSFSLLNFQALQNLTESMASIARTPLSFFVLILIALPTLVFAIRTLRNAPLSEEDRQYNEGDYIPLFANKVYSNQEDSW